MKKLILKCFYEKENNMKKFIFLLLLLTTPLYAADQWTKTNPAGSDLLSTIDTTVESNNEATDRLLYDFRRNMTVIPDTANQINVLAGSIAMPNGAGSIVKWRRTTSTTLVTWADIDTGSEAITTQYYVYATGDTDITGCVYKISSSSTSPSGSTYYRKIGYFYNDSSGNIVSVGNVKSGDVPNSIIVSGTTDITTSSTSYVDMADMLIYFYSSGRPVEVIWNGSVFPPNGNGDQTIVTINIDGINYSPSMGWGQNTADGYYQTFPIPSITLQNLAAGTHTIKAQWKVSKGTTTQYGTLGQRILIAEEK